MLTTRKENLKLTDDGKGVISAQIIIEVPILLEMLQECYMFNAMDAPTETKRMLMEALGEKIDEIILAEQPESYNDNTWLKSKLNQVEVKINELQKIEEHPLKNEPLTNPTGITIRQLKYLVKNLPETNAAGCENEVWIGSNPCEFNASNVCKSIYKLNGGDIILEIN